MHQKKSNLQVPLSEVEVNLILKNMSGVKKLIVSQTGPSVKSGISKYELE